MTTVARVTAGLGGLFVSQGVLTCSGSCGVEVALVCARCGKRLEKLDAALAQVEPAGPRAHAQNTWPQPGSWRWIGYVQQKSGSWIKVAEADTPEAAWHAMDMNWLFGDRMVVPLRPGGGAAGEEGDGRAR